MTIGASLFLIAVGAILRWAVIDSIEGVDLTTVGLILLIVGVVGLAIGLWQTQRTSRGVRHDEVPPPPADRRY
jgi:uncharacterized membrane protein YidH (DUF202 family)